MIYRYNTFNFYVQIFNKFWIEKNNKLLFGQPVPPLIKG